MFEGVGLAALILLGLAVKLLPAMHAARFSRRLRAAPTLSIDKLPEGTPGKISGVVRFAGKTLEAPLTGRRCSIYRAYVYSFHPQADGGDEHRALVNVITGLPFWVEDETGRALVYPDDAQIHINMDAHEKCSETAPATARMKELLLAFAQVEPDEIDQPMELSFDEGIIEEGERIEVMGYASREPDQQGQSAATGYRDLPPMCLVFRATKKHPLILADSEKHALVPAKD